ncbi:MAG: hypothetical protein NUW37_13970 [Planctomycetes bacterium]|nr:hypothetical protein [Planctomycetota bacterium]
MKKILFFLLMFNAASCSLYTTRESEEGDHSIPQQYRDENEAESESTQASHRNAEEQVENIVAILRKHGRHKGNDRELREIARSYADWIEYYNFPRRPADYSGVIVGVDTSSNFFLPSIDDSIYEVEYEFSEGVVEVVARDIGEDDVVLSTIRITFVITQDSEIAWLQTLEKVTHTTIGTNDYRQTVSVSDDNGEPLFGDFCVDRLYSSAEYSNGNVLSYFDTHIVRYLMVNNIVASVTFTEPEPGESSFNLDSVTDDLEIYLNLLPIFPDASLSGYLPHVNFAIEKKIILPGESTSWSASITDAYSNISLQAENVDGQWKWTGYPSGDVPIDNHLGFGQLPQTSQVDLLRVRDFFSPYLLGEGGNDGSNGLQITIPANHSPEFGNDDIWELSVSAYNRLGLSATASDFYVVGKEITLRIEQECRRWRRFTFSISEVWPDDSVGTFLLDDDAMTFEMRGPAPDFITLVWDDGNVTQVRQSDFRNNTAYYDSHTTSLHDLIEARAMVAYFWDGEFSLQGMRRSGGEDQDRGHGNDDDRHDEDNPGQGHEGRGDDDDHDRGHGNDDDHNDEDNPGRGNGHDDRGNDHQGDDRDRNDNNDRSDVPGWRDERDDDDRGHGNDDDRHDDDNPGRGYGRSDDQRGHRNDDRRAPHRAKDGPGHGGVTGSDSRRS